MIACGHTVRIVSLLGSHLFERLELPIVTVIANLTKERMSFFFFSLLFLLLIMLLLLAQGVEAVLRLTGAFRVFAKLAIWHENRELRASALMAVANLMINGMLSFFISFIFFFEKY